MNKGMQIATTGGTGCLPREDNIKRLASSFRALFVISASKRVGPGVLGKQLGLSDDDFGVLLESLQGNYLGTRSPS